MTQYVRLSICGLQTGMEMEDSVTTNVDAEYYYRRGNDFLLYNEKHEGFQKPTRNIIKVKGNIVEFTRTGIIQTKMVFEKNRNYHTTYVTPYGNIFLEIDTKKVEVEKSEESLKIRIEYSLTMDGEYVSEASIDIHARLIEAK